MTLFSLKQFKWDKEKNILLIHSDNPLLSENWDKLVIQKGYFAVKSHVTDVTYNFLYETTVDAPDNRWERIIFYAPGTDSKKIPKIHILPPWEPL